MGKYDDIEFQRLLQTPIADILAHFGKDCRPRRKNMYLSPFREERTASFCVKSGESLWFDFGTGEGGGAIDLVCALAGCSRKESLDILSIINGRYPPMEDIRPRTSPESKKDEASVIITRIAQTFTNPTLIDYAESRGIPKEILDRNCQQVHFHLASNPKRKIIAIGFMNDNGGYSLRSTRMKISTSSFISTIRGTDDASGRIFVFEGFFDYLSFLAIRKEVSLPESALVMNGVGNVAHALKVLKDYREVNLLLDNDQAGRKCRDTITEHLSRECPETNVCDLSAVYGKHKDLNPMLCNESTTGLPSNNTAYGHKTIKRGPAEAGQDQLG